MALPPSPSPPPPSHPLLIRVAVPSDAPSGHFTHLSSWQTSYVDLLTPAQIAYLPSIPSFASPANFLLRLTHPEQNTLVAIHPTTGDVVGFATATKEEDEYGYLTLQSVYLLEEWKGKGLGRRLTDGVLPERGDGKERRALVVCLADNKPGRDFYEKLGFTRVIRTELIEGLGLNRVTLARDANGPETERENVQPREGLHRPADKPATSLVA